MSYRNNEKRKSKSKITWCLFMGWEAMTERSLRETKLWMMFLLIINLTIFISILKSNDLMLNLSWIKSAQRLTRINKKCDKQLKRCLKLLIKSKMIKSDFCNTIRKRSQGIKWSKTLMWSKIWRKKSNYCQQINQSIISIRIDLRLRFHHDFKRMITSQNTINLKVLLRITLLLRKKNLTQSRESLKRMLMITIEVENSMNSVFTKLEVITQNWPKM